MKIQILLHIFMFLIEELIKYFVTKIIFVTKTVKADFNFLIICFSFHLLMNKLLRLSAKTQEHMKIC